MKLPANALRLLIVLCAVALFTVGFNIAVEPSPALVDELEGVPARICSLHSATNALSNVKGIGGTALYQIGDSSIDLAQLINFLELPFLLIAVVFAFRTATALKGGIFGNGMRLVAFGALVMAIGHLHLQLQTHLDINLFGLIFGELLGSIIWIAALIATWGLTGAGFFSILKASQAT